MQSILLSVGVVAFVGYQLAKFTEVWLSRGEKHRLLNIIEEAWLRFDDAKFIIIVQAPLKLLSYLYDDIFGLTTISSKAAIRISLLSIGILVMSLAMQITTHQPILNFWNAPFLHYDEQFTFVETLLSQREEIIRNNPTQNYDQLFYYLTDALKYRASHYKVIYTISFIFLSSVLFVLLNTATISITRLMLREVLETNGIILMIGILLFDLILALLIGSFTLVLLTLLSFPVAVPILYKGFIFIIEYPTLAGLVYLATSTILWQLGSGLFQTVVIIAILPALILLFSISGSIVLHPIRKPIYKSINQFLLRASQHDKGFLVFTGTFFGVLAGLVTLISRYFV